MALSGAEKAQVIKNFRRSKEDTGSSEVQIALLSTRIEELTRHLKTNPHDYHTRRGLTIMVSRRRKLMSYLKRVNPQVYKDVITRLEVRG